jgi:hypothetical protein
MTTAALTNKKPPAGVGGCDGEQAIAVAGLQVFAVDCLGKAEAAALAAVAEFAQQRYRAFAADLGHGLRLGNGWLLAQQLLQTIATRSKEEEERRLSMVRMARVGPKVVVAESSFSPGVLNVAVLPAEVVQALLDWAANRLPARFLGRREAKYRQWSEEPWQAERSAPKQWAVSGCDSWRQYQLIRL